MPSALEEENESQRKRHQVTSALNIFNYRVATTVDRFEENAAV